MKKILIASILYISCFIVGCSSEKDDLYSEIKSIEKVLLSDINKVNDSLAMVYAGKCENFADRYPDDAQSPELLFKAGEVLSGINRYHLSIRKFQDVYLRYPKYPKRAESIFLCAFIYETNLQNYDEAKFHYEMFLKEYPKHPLAKDAELSIQNLGKSPEELVSEFELKNDTL